jgi:hypothetical protein
MGREEVTDSLIWRRQTVSSSSSVEREYARYHGIINSGRNPRCKYPFKRQGGVFEIAAKARGKWDVAEDNGGGHGG